MRWCSMKSHERLKAEGWIERFLADNLELDQGLIDENGVYRCGKGDFLIEIKATYLGGKTKRLTEPAEDVLD